jgi:GNAT superfamily N-acetyltransferase
MECADVFYDALDQLSVERHQAPWPMNAEPMVRLYARLLASHPTGGAMAEHEGRAIGFAIAVERQRSWFLGFLFVRPAHQGRGIGRRLLEQVLPTGGVDAWLADGGVLATCAEAVQPVATGLYASYGMRPRDPISMLVGSPRPGALRRLPRSIEALPFALVEDDLGATALAELLEPLDVAAVGYRRDVDHAADRGEGRQGVLYRDRRGGQVRGYGYAQPSGRLGPATATDPELLEPIVRDLIERVPVSGAWQLVVPGASAAMTGLLHAGLRLDEPPILHCSTAPSMAVESYLLRSYALP